MLLKLYPKVHRRYTSLPILGPIFDGFGTWLLKQGYATDCVREHFCTARRLTRILGQRGVQPGQTDAGPTPSVRSSKQTR